AVAALPFGIELCRVYFAGNFHTVLPGRIYRSAQPSADDVRRAVRDHGVCTIVNLRGCGQPFDWYMDECRAAQQMAIAQEDISFSANRIPSATELRRLVEVLDRAEYPLLFHCRRGADRTGMVSTIALLLQNDVTLAQARRQLGPRYGHVRLGKTAALDRF